MTPPRNTRRTIIAVLVVLLVAVGAYFGVHRLTQRNTQVRYITRAATYADISSSASETGTINPVNQVQVGSQVSGTIVSLNVDFNSRVTKGEVLATLDPAPFQASVEQASANYAAAQSNAAATASSVTQAGASVASVAATFQQQQASLRSAQANVGKAKAQVALANLTVQRDMSLVKQGFIAQNQLDADRTAAETSAQDYQVALAAVAVAQAQVQAAAAQLRSSQQQIQTAADQAAASQHQVTASAAQVQTAQYNLARTVITSPINGIVMARNVSVGQTVAASFQTPTLFTIASNLTDMQVDTSVDEADVGNVKTGEVAHISVTAYPNVTFLGSVQQVRLNPVVVQNVVTYDAVIVVHDSTGRLRPGMTAQVSIEVGARTHVITVPTAALLYRPQTQRGSSATSATSGGGGGLFGNASLASAPVAGAPGSQVTVWVLRNGRPAPISVTIGLSDNLNVEITNGLQAGDNVIVAQVRGASKSRATGGGGTGGRGTSPVGPGGGP
jgi:HlyD family secretion protein